ncbi:glycerophosphodiester phosphodiesterase [Falsibacillus albus]|uniref:Glycerophosphodiester phosphodiesterase n=2 Tax=Falsibacillus albus TaxID=2478915 RepID=A0A3L7JIU6_9BACI|nr:glycerophosphodiester phosphodiesterase [Falsibacillus albus]RLQ90623.1 glycerophosphodiester phosphodiesterase [Falsibacillus albus]
MKLKTKVLLFILMAFIFIISAKTIAAEITPLPPKMKSSFLIIGHRGASGLAPEHTFSSYDLVNQRERAYIEIDLQMTKDGKLIAMHDPTLDRTTNGNGLVKDKSLKDIKSLDAGSWFNENTPQHANPAYKGEKVPTLEEIFQRYGSDAHYYIETKSPGDYPGMEENLLQLLAKYHIQKGSNVIIESFSKASLQKIHRLAPSIPLVQLLLYKQAEDGGFVEMNRLTSSPSQLMGSELDAIHQYAVGIGMNYRYGNKFIVRESFIQKARAHGLLVHPFTVNDKGDMKRLYDWGATGMFTNFPERLHQVYKQSESEAN